MYQVTIKTTSESAHFLRDYEGKCARLHGHSYRYFIVIESTKLDKRGFVVDFGEVKEIIKPWDHRLFNDFPEFGTDGLNPTAENIAKVTAMKIQDHLDNLENSPRVVRVEVRETEKGQGIYVPPKDRD